jgi:hypothetical protein
MIPRKLTLAIAAGTVLFGAFLGGAAYGQTPISDNGVPDFSKYPKSTAFDYFIEQHRSELFWFGGDDDPKIPLVIALSHFWTTGNDAYHSALQYFVTDDGALRTRRTIYNWAVQSVKNSALTKEQLSQLAKAIERLPKTNTYPPIGQLVIVSFRERGIWVTRTCRPEDVRPIFDVIGERAETAH